MVKKFVPVPDEIHTALVNCVKERYREEISKLPDIGMPNPAVSAEATSDGFSGDAKFYGADGKYRTSLWEYKTNNRRWHMCRDWDD